tara:strand:+ start:4305 stop:4934 length:630 start_codon:yes stop_codon:yes gene_type:complete
MSLPYKRKEDVNIFMNEYNEKLNKNRCLARLLENDDYINANIEYALDRATAIRVAKSPDTFEKIIPSGVNDEAIPPGNVPNLIATEEEVLSASTTLHKKLYRFVSPDTVADNLNDDDFSYNREVLIDIVHLGPISNQGSIRTALDYIKSEGMVNQFFSGTRVIVAHRSSTKGGNHTYQADVVRSYFEIDGSGNPVYVGTRLALIYTMID